MFVGKGQLVFEVPDPIAVRAVLPHAKTITYKGKPHVVVKHELDAVMILRNIGIDAPSPVNYGWQYPGRYQPFKHQKATVEFLTLNRRAFVLSGMGCVDADTEYLSATGWRRIANYDGGRVTQYDPETGGTRLVTPHEYIKLPCDEMYHLTTKYGVDQMLSAEHRVLVYDRERRDRYEVLSAEALERRLAGEPLSAPSRWAWEKHGQISRRSLGFATTFSPAGGKGISLSDEALRVQVAVCADGYIPKAKTGWCYVRVKKERKKLRLRQLLTAANIVWDEKSNDYPTAVGFTTFKFIPPLQEKTYGAWAWEATKEQLSVVADEFVHWDGSLRKAGGRTFSSYSKESADFIQYACAASGFTATLTAHTRQRRGRVETEYVVLVRAKADVLGVMTGLPEDRVAGKKCGVRGYSMPKVPTSDGFKYCFSVPSGFLILRRNGCIFATGNSGKTAATLWAAEYLMQKKLVRRALIVCPKSCTHKVWEDAVFQTIMHRTAVVVEGSRERKRELYTSSAEYVIVNHDGLATISDLINADDALDLVVYDEASVLRNGQTQRYKTLKGILKPVTRLWLLTATPCPNAPTDAWALARLIKPETVPPYFGSFKRQTMFQVTNFKWVAKPEGTKLAYDAMQPAIRFRTEDCIDLPPVTYQNRACTLSTEQTKMLKAMAKDFVADKDGATITAANAAVKMVKMLQLCGGVCYDDAGNAVLVDPGDRLSTLMEILEEADHKVIVWCPYKHAMAMIRQEVSKVCGVAVINGDVSTGERSRIITEFQDESNPLKVLVAHPATAAHGLTLTAANIVVWYGPTFSAEMYEQAVARVVRPGQKHHMTVIHLGSAALEWDAYDVAKEKVGRQKKILALYNKLLDIAS